MLEYSREYSKKSLTKEKEAPTEKECRECSIVKPIREFYKEKSSKDGYRNHCGKCSSSKRRDYVNQNRDVVNTQKRAHYNQNKEEILSKRREEYKKDPEPRRRSSRESGRRHKVAKVIRAVIRRNRIRRTQPKWTLKHAVEIKSIHKERSDLDKKTGLKHHVDHIIPLTSRIVCGLDVPWNLQILTSSENTSKSNKFDGTYENMEWRSRI